MANKAVEIAFETGTLPVFSYRNYVSFHKKASPSYQKCLIDDCVDSWYIFCMWSTRAIVGTASISIVAIVIFIAPHVSAQVYILQDFLSPTTQRLKEALPSLANLLAGQIGNLSICSSTRGDALIEYDPTLKAYKKYLVDASNAGKVREILRTLSDSNEPVPATFCATKQGKVPLKSIILTHEGLCLAVFSLWLHNLDIGKQARLAFLDNPELCGVQGYFAGQSSVTPSYYPYQFYQYSGGDNF